VCKSRAISLVGGAVGGTIKGMAATDRGELGREVGELVRDQMDEH
jgi:hypothetical protein